MAIIFPISLWPFACWRYC